jgi:hypothetical protein
LAAGMVKNAPPHDWAPRIEIENEQQPRNNNTECGLSFGKSRTSRLFRAATTARNMWPMVSLGHSAREKIARIGLGELGRFALSPAYCRRSKTVPLFPRRSTKARPARHLQRQRRHRDNDDNDDDVARDERPCSALTVGFIHYDRLANEPARAYSAIAGIYYADQDNRQTSTQQLPAAPSSSQHHPAPPSKFPTLSSRTRLI